MELKTGQKRKRFFYLREAGVLALLCLLAVGCLWGCETAATEDFQTKPEYLRSATYFGDEWAVNFWNTEGDDLAADMEQIAADGFNSIILILPWREFQPSLDPVGYNEYALTFLDRVMEAAREAGLWVSLRVGYTWDYADDGQDVRERFRNLMGDEAVLAAWDDYVKTVYDRALAHGNLWGGFLTWEDFWSFTYYAKAMGDTQESRDMARFCGYSAYLEEHYGLDEINALYGGQFTAYDQIPLPTEEQPALGLFYEFFDQWLNGFLEHNQQIFPDLSMEVRMDADQVRDENGELYWYGHEATYGCGDSGYTALMYGVPIGHINQGERLEASEALEKSQQMLDQVLASSEGKKLYIEQFLYMDNTPGFEHNAQVKEDQVDDYIVAMAQVFRDRIVGYGVWTYKNYGNNLLYNPQFALEDTGWQLNEKAQIAERDSSCQACLEAGGQLTNPVASEGTLTYVRFTADAPDGASLTVTLGSDTKVVETEPGQTPAELIFENGGTGLTILSDNLCYVDNVKVYTRVQEGQLYDLDGNEGTCIEAVRTLNKKLR